MSYVMGRYERTTLWLVRNNKTNNTFSGENSLKRRYVSPNLKTLNVARTWSGKNTTTFRWKAGKI